MEAERKFAILIDAENISQKYMDIIIREANNLGTIIYRRIYGDWTSQAMDKWKNTILDFALQPVQQFRNISGKNSSDSALIIDAMDLLYDGRADGFCIVSSDSDFTRLASRLRESEKFIAGMGESKTPRSLISACDTFLYLDKLLHNEEKVSEDAACACATAAEEAQRQKPTEPGRGTPGQKRTPPAAPAAPAAAPARATQPEEVTGTDRDTIIKAIRNIMTNEHNTDDDGWIHSSQLFQLLTKNYPDFSPRNFNFSKFVPFIESLKIFEVVKKGSGTAKTVLFKLI